MSNKPTVANGVARWKLFSFCEGQMFYGSTTMFIMKPI